MGHLINVNSLFSEYGIPARRAYALARSNIIPHVRVGRQIRFTRAAIEEWIESGGRCYELGWKKGANEE